MKTIRRILYLEDNPRDVELLRTRMEDAGFEGELTMVATKEQFEAALAQGPWDLVLSDYNLPSYDGLSALNLTRQKSPDTPFIIFSGSLGEEHAVKSLQLGAADYIVKQRSTRLVPAIQRALADARGRQQQRQAEAVIRLQSATLEAAANAIVITRCDGTIEWVNPAFVVLTGYGAKEVVGKSPRLLKSNQHNAAFYKKLWDMILAGQVWQGEMTNRRKDGSLIIVNQTITPVRDERDQINHFIGISVDITEKKKLETQSLRAQRMESIGTLAGGIAHDLNNVLAPIMMGVELLREELPSADKAKMLDMMKNSAHRGAEMVKQILSFTRGIAGEPALLDLKHLVAEMKKLVTETFPRSISIETELTRHLYPVWGNPTQLHQVLLNLCVNARDAMPDSGTLRIAAESVVLTERITPWHLAPVSGPHVVLTVSDTGQGMPPEVLNRLFEPFFTTKDLGKGTGLGLSTVKGIVKGQGGFLEVASQMGKGTTFKIYLPAADEGRTEAAAAEPSALPVGHGEQILVVDDEIPILEMTRKMLENYNYRVLTATDGAEAVALYRSHKGEIQVVMTDMMMPIMDGPATIQVLQKIDPQVKIIAVSGQGSETTLSRASHLKVDAFLRKPYTTKALLAALQSVVERK